MRALSDVLAIANPVVFGNLSRIQELALGLAKHLKVPEQWALEFASVATQLGHIALPERTVRHLYSGEELSPEEGAQIARSAEVAEGILQRIPRLGPVVNILSHLAADRKEGASESIEARAAEILRVASAFAAAESTTASRGAAVHRLRAQAGRFDPEVVKALTELLGLEVGANEVIEVPISRIRVGMILAEDLCTHAGVLLVPKGYRVSESFVARIRNYNQDSLPTVVRTRTA
jgi:response regulator RpfG family c-di-GMP phosphodiesterase